MTRKVRPGGEFARPTATGSSPAVQFSRPLVTGSIPAVSSWPPRVAGSFPAVQFSRPRLAGSTPRVMGSSSRDILRRLKLFGDSDLVRFTSQRPLPTRFWALS